MISHSRFNISLAEQNHATHRSYAKLCFLKGGEHFTAKVSFKEFWTKKEVAYLRGNVCVQWEWEAKLLALLISNCWTESFQANHRLMTVFFPDSSTHQLATHSPINTTMMVGNSTPHPGTDITAVGLCKSLCVCVCIWVYLCPSEGWERASSSDLQIIVNWLVGTKPRTI